MSDDRETFRRLVETSQAVHPKRIEGVRVSGSRRDRPGLLPAIGLGILSAIIVVMAALAVNRSAQQRRSVETVVVQQAATAVAESLSGRPTPQLAASPSPTVACSALESASRREEQPPAEVLSLGTPYVVVATVMDTGLARWNTSDGCSPEDVEQPPAGYTIYTPLELKIEQVIVDRLKASDSVQYGVYGGTVGDASVNAPASLKRLEPGRRYVLFANTAATADGGSDPSLLMINNVWPVDSRDRVTYPDGRRRPLAGAVEHLRSAADTDGGAGPNAGRCVQLRGLSSICLRLAAEPPKVSKERAIRIARENGGRLAFSPPKASHWIPSGIGAHKGTAWVVQFDATVSARRGLAGVRLPLEVISFLDILVDSSTGEVAFMYEGSIGPISTPEDSSIDAQATAIARKEAAIATATAEAKQNPTPTPTPTIRAEDLPPCDPDQLVLSLGAEGATGSMVLGLRISNRGGPCRLAAEVTLALEDSSGRTLAIKGNPATKRLDVALPSSNAPEDNLYMSRLLHNWCGKQRAFLLRAELLGKAAVSRLRHRARCDAPEHPPLLSDLHVVTYDR